MITRHAITGGLVVGCLVWCANATAQQVAEAQVTTTTSTFELHIAADTEQDKTVIEWATAKPDRDVLDGSDRVAMWAPIRPGSMTAVTGDPRLVTRSLSPGTTELLVLCDPLSKPVDQSNIAYTYSTTDQNGKPAVYIQLEQQGAIKLAQITAAHNDRHLAILVDGEVHAAPRIMTTLSQVIISGGYTSAEASKIETDLTPVTTAASSGPPPSAISVSHVVYFATPLMLILAVAVLAAIVCGGVIIIFALTRRREQ